MVARDASTLEEEDRVEDEDGRRVGAALSSTRGCLAVSCASLLLIDSSLMAARHRKEKREEQWHARVIGCV